MQWCRSSLIVGFLVLAVVLAGALAQQPGGGPPVPPKRQAGKPLKSDPAADQALGRALERVDPKHFDWLKTTLWQQLDVQGLTFQAEGTYLVGKSGEVHLDLRLHAGSAGGSLEVRSNGKTVWEVTRIGSQPPSVTKTELGKALNLLAAPNLAQKREEFLQSQSFVGGLVPLLTALKKQVAFTERQDARWGSRAVILLTGTWMNPGFEEKDWPESMPRRCRLYLDAETYWPLRIEWWGPAGGRSDDTLLMQLEFRNPEYPDTKDVDRKQFTLNAREFVDGTASCEAKAKKLVQASTLRR
jgi:hypothetical protein